MKDQVILKDTADIEGNPSAIEDFEELKRRVPLAWATEMNNKGIGFMAQGKYAEAAGCFESAYTLADDFLKCRLLINSARSSFFGKEKTYALRMLDRAEWMLKSPDVREKQALSGHIHLLKGQIFYKANHDRPLVLKAFKTAEHAFDLAADLRGVGQACVEIVRVHINNRNMPVAWNYLQRGEACFERYDHREKLGVLICKAVALYYSSREIEAQRILQDIYKLYDEFGQGRYPLSQILDVYLDIHSRSPQYVMEHGLR